MLDISEITHAHSLGFKLQDVKVSFKTDVSLSISDIHIDSKQGEMISVPRWVADVLVSENVVDIQDSDMVVSLKQTIVKENVQGEFDLSTLDPDFYIKIRSYMKRLPQEDKDKLESMLNTLIRKRQGKIIQLADSSKMTSELSKKLSVEEKAFFNGINSQSRKFRQEILGDKQ